MSDVEKRDWPAKKPRPEPVLKTFGINWNNQLQCLTSLMLLYLVEHLISKAWRKALIHPFRCYNSFHSSGKDFYTMLEHGGCRDLLPFRHESITEVRRYCRAMRFGSQSTVKLIP